jgi:hypothetical protein
MTRFEISGLVREKVRVLVLLAMLYIPIKSTCFKASRLCPASS